MVSSTAINWVILGFYQLYYTISKIDNVKKWYFDLESLEVELDFEV